MPPNSGIGFSAATLQQAPTQARTQANGARVAARSQVRQGDGEEIELPLLKAVRELLDDADGDTADDLGEDLDELRELLDDAAEPWRNAKAQMRQGIREANRRFQTVPE